MASIGDVFIRMVADATGFSAQLEREAVKAGDKAGTSMGQTMGQKAGRAIATGLGTAIGGVLGTASALGAELDTATKNFAADVGATAEETKSAQSAIAGLYRTNILSFQQASDTLAALRTDLGLTQDDANEAAQSFVDFGKVARVDAAEGVRDLDDILDAWNLNAEDAQGVMDQLVVSHQEYGGSITDNAAALAKLAPQLQGLGADLDDGVGLLNLFAASGLDSAAASAALNTAVRKLKPGQNLDDLVAQISSIEDPTQRAQAAIDVFGARGGVNLANALRPGVDSLSEFTVTASEAAGATERAADVIDSSFGTQVQLVIRNFGGALAEAATNFGPLILGISQLGGRRAAAAIGSAIGGLAGNLGSRLAGGLGTSFGKALSLVIPSKLGPALTEAGTSSKTTTALGKLGSKLATGLSAGLKGAVSIVSTGLSTLLGKVGLSGAFTTAVAKLGALIGTSLGSAAAAVMIPIIIGALAGFTVSQQQIDASGKAIGEKFGESITGATVTELERMKREIQDKLKFAETLGPLGDLSGFTPTLRRALAQVETDLLAAGANAGSAVSEGVEDGITRDMWKTEDAAELLADAAIDPLTGLPADADAIGADIALGLASGLRSEKEQVDAAFEQLKTDAEEQLAPLARIAYLVGILTSPALAKGLNDEREVVRLQAEATRTIAEAELAELVGSAGGTGKDTTAAIAAGMKSGDPDVQAQAQRTSNLIATTLQNTPNGGREAGQDVGDDVSAGLAASKAKVIRATRGLIQSIRSVLVNTKAGQVRVNVDVISGGGFSGHRQHGGPVFPGGSFVVGERGPEVFVPRVPGTIVPNHELPAGTATAAAGNTTTINVTGVRDALLPFEIVEQQRRLERFRELRTRPSKGVA